MVSSKVSIIGNVILELGCSSSSKFFDILAKMLNRVNLQSLRNWGKCLHSSQCIGSKAKKNIFFSKLKLNGKSFYLVVICIVSFEASEIIIINEHT